MHPSKILNMYFATHRTCNLGCKYCYVPEYNRELHKESDTEIIKSLSKFIRKVENEGYAIGSFCLHGSEPTLMEPETLAEIIMKMNKHWQDNKITGHSVALQSNGVRLTKKYLRKIIEITGEAGKLKPGFSIDPPKAIHDKYRNNSYDKVIKNFEDAISLGFMVSVLSVVTSDTISNLDSFGKWMKYWLGRKKRHGNPYRIKIKFATGEMAPDEAEIQKLSEFLAENNLLKLAQILSEGYCIQQGNECMWFEFDINGNCYSCNKTYNNEGIFANWMQQSFEEIFEKRKKLFSDVIRSPECSECMYEYICNSGCPVDRYKSGIMAGKAHECTLIKYAYEHIDKKGIHIVDFYNNNIEQE